MELGSPESVKVRDVSSFNLSFYCKIILLSLYVSADFLSTYFASTICVYRFH